MYDAYQEHCDHVMGCDTEYRNMYAIERATMKPDDSERIAELVESGKFVVVAEVTEYGPVTDAIIGSRLFVDSIHDTREAAEAAMAGMTPEDFDYETSYHVEPKPVVERKRYVPEFGEDDIPF